MAAGNSYLCSAATEQVLLPWENASVLDHLPELIQKIGFSPKVQAMIQLIDTRLGDVSFRSYHLRRGDIIDDKALASHNLWPTKYIPRVIYEWHMQRELSQGEGMLVIFSDAPEETEAFTAMSSRIYSFDDLVGEEELTPLQRDFLELYTMSRSHRIFAPPGSAFSQTAAIIGNKPIIDIMGSLTRSERSAAFDELANRLEKRPEVFLNQADAGQNFPFVISHLDRRGEQGRATGIIMGHFKAGMNRGYVYSLLSERLLAEGNYDGCDEVVQALDDQACYREEHWSAAYHHAALADMIRGNWSRAIQRFQAGTWYFPIGQLTAESFWYLGALGHLSPSNTYPFDPDLMRNAARIFSAGSSPAFRILMNALREAGVQPQRYPVNMEVRDWRRLHGKKLSFRFSNKAKIAQQATQMANSITKASNTRQTALQSACGVLYTEAGNLHEAEPYLKGALDAQPDQPLYIKRYADFLRSSGRLDDAIGFYSRAWEVSGRNPCYQVELALAYQAQKDRAQNEKYLGLMLDLRDSDTPIIEIRFLIIEAMRRKPELLAEAVENIEALQGLAPGSHRVWALKAKVYEQSGMWHEALSAIRDLDTVGRPESIVRSKFLGLYKAYRRSHDEQSAKKWFVSEGLGWVFA